MHTSPRQYQFPSIAKQQHTTLPQLIQGREVDSQTIKNKKRQNLDKNGCANLTHTSQDPAQSEQKAIKENHGTHTQTKIEKNTHKGRRKVKMKQVREEENSTAVSPQVF